MKTLVSFIVAGVLLVLAPLSLAAIQPLDKGRDDPTYPHRAKYPDTPVIDTAELTKKLGEVAVVDVRSELEYNTLRVKGSTNISVDDPRFNEKVQALRQQTNKPLVFYCNGKTCAKSYKAARRAIQSAKLDQCFVYDPGIFEWARNNPNNTELLGKGPIKVESLIEKAKLEQHMLKPKDFLVRVDQGAMVLDVRDLAQRDVALFPFKEKRVSLSQPKALDAVIEQAKREKKTLLVYDKAGHQVRWLQYHLEEAGLKDYYFMKGGEAAYFQETLGVSTVDSLKKYEKK
jgi:rhodanese-related sulfurtransferase